MATISNKTASTSISVSAPNLTLIHTKYFNFGFIFSSLVSVHIMVFNYTSFYFFGGAEKKIEIETVWFEIVAIQIFPRRVWKSYLLLHGKIRMATISNKTASTSISVSAPNLTLIHTNY